MKKLLYSECIFLMAPQWLSERRISSRWMPLSESSELERKSSICIRVKQIRTDPTTSSLNRPRSDHGLNSSVFHWELYFEHRFRPRVQLVSSEQQNRGHVLRSHTNHESNVLVVNKPLESSSWSQLRCQRHVDHDKFQLCDYQETCIHFWIQPLKPRWR